MDPVDVHVHRAGLEEAAIDIIAAHDRNQRDDFAAVEFPDAVDERSRRPVLLLHGFALIGPRNE